MKTQTNRFRVSLFIILLLPAISIAFITGDNRSQYSLPRAANSVCTGDLDSDGDQDIVVGHNYNQATNWDGISILRNNSLGVFEPDSFYLYGNHESILIQKLDNNQNPDLITQYNNGIITCIGVLLDADSNSMNILSYELIHNPDKIECGDLNGDSATDILFISVNYKIWGVLLNDGTGLFSSPEYFNLTYPPQDISTGDLNGDGRDDVAICSQTIEVYFSYPSGFQKLVLDSLDFRHRIKVVDFDMDGKKDLFSVEDIYGIINYYNVFQNLGNNTFVKLAVSSFQPGAVQFTVNDFDNDNLPDVAFLMDNNTGYAIYYNQGNFQLADSQFVALPSHGYWELRRKCTSDDLDNNGFNDLIATRFAHVSMPSNLDILFNDGQGHFGPDPIVSAGNGKSRSGVFFSNFPNPFSEETTFTFGISETAVVELSVYTLQGVLCARMIDRKLTAGIYSEKWRPAVYNGLMPGPGVYLASLKRNGRVVGVIKMVVT